MQNIFNNTDKKIIDFERENHTLLDAEKQVRKDDKKRDFDLERK